MPTLKQISCALELGTSTRLKEYDHRYTDGGVEAFVAVPDTPIPFHIHITSSGYIAPGLAAYVFMDGRYQCNRNRQNLTLPTFESDDPRTYEIDFKLRQKEEKTSDGSFVAREWTFAQLSTGNADTAPDINPSFAQNVGTIEIVVLRCKDGGIRGDAIDPAHTVLDIDARKGTSSRPGSVTKADPASKPVAAGKAPSTWASAAKAPSKAPSKVASEAGGLGGFAGLFDGAGDDYAAECDGANDYHRGEYDRRAASYVSRRNPPPEYHWDARLGAYRHDPSLDRFPDRFERGYKSAEVDRYSLEVQHRHSATPSHELGGDRGDFVFIEESAKQIELLVTRGTELAKKHAIMEQKAINHRHEPDVFPTMTRALHRKAQEIASLNEEITGLYRSMDACMRTMDNWDYQSVRGFLHQKRILPEMQIELATPLPTPATQQAELKSSRPRTVSRDPVTPADNDWQPVGSGKTKASLWERKQQQNSRDVSNKQWQTQAQTRGDAQDIDGTSKWTGNGHDDAWARARHSPRSTVGWQHTSGALHSPPKSQRSQKSDGWGSGQKSNVAQPKFGNRGGEWDTGHWSEDKQVGNDWGQDGNKNDWNAGACGENDDNQNNGAWGNDAAAGGDRQGVNKNWGLEGANSGDNNDHAANSNWDGGEQKKDDWDRASQHQSKKADQGEWSNQEKDGGEGKQAGTWAEQPEANQAADWGGKQKPASQAQGKANSQAVGNSWGNDGAQPALHDVSRDIATAVSAIRPVIKSYWGDWAKKPEPNKKPRAQPREPYIYPAPPSVAAPSGKAPNVSHGVQAGRGANYVHKLHRPEYLDTMQQPYAIFTFKYRSQAALEKILNRKIDTSNVQRAVQEIEQERLMRLPKDELVAELMRKQTLMGKPAADSGGQAAAKPATDNGWGGNAGEVKPSDSVSNVGSRKSDNDGWQEVGKGEVKAGGDHKSEAASEHHWASDDPQLKQVW